MLKYNKILHKKSPSHCQPTSYLPRGNQRYQSFGRLPEISIYICRQTVAYYTIYSVIYFSYSKYISEMGPYQAFFFFYTTHFSIADFP